MKMQDLCKPKRKRTIAIPLAQMESVIHCVQQALDERLADFILIGNKAKIMEIARDNDFALEGVEFIEIADEAEACLKAAELVRGGAAQAIMKGLTQTSSLLRPLLDKSNGIIPEDSLISLVTVFDIPRYHKALALTDAAINIAPDLGQKVKIIRNAVVFLRALGIARPKVACVAPVEQVSPKIQSTVDAYELSRMPGAFGEAVVEGPMGFDIAVSREAASIKGTASEVAGDPDLLLLPDLNSANAVYKTLTSFAGATGAGIIAGLKIPVVLTSRSDSHDTKYLSMKMALCVDPVG